MNFRKRRMKRDDTQNQSNSSENPPEGAAQPGAQPAPRQDAHPGDPQQEPSHTDFSKLMSQLDQATAEAQDYKDRYLRSVADFDNFRRRATREKEEIRRYAASDLVEGLLPVIDNLALALDSARQHHPEAAAVIEGVEMIQQQLRGVLKSNGVEAIDPQGQPFDPNLHESIARHPSADVAEGNVMAVTRTGYTLNGRLIRPATVVLSAGPAQEDA
jgi:molecular chaperone GrpE